MVIDIAYGNCGINTGGINDGVDDIKTNLIKKTPPLSNPTMRKRKRSMTGARNT